MSYPWQETVSPASGRLPADLVDKLVNEANDGRFTGPGNAIFCFAFVLVRRVPSGLGRITRLSPRSLMLFVIHKAQSLATISTSSGDCS